MTIFAIDFDGTCVTHAFPAVGEDIGAVPVLKALVEKGHRLILYTMRSAHHLDAAVKWFEKNEIELYGVQTNPSQKNWTSSPKCYAHVYIDDAGLGIPLKQSGVDRPYVDWAAVKILLEAQGYFGDNHLAVEKIIL